MQIQSGLGLGPLGAYHLTEGRRLHLENHEGVSCVLWTMRKVSGVSEAWNIPEKHLGEGDTPAGSIKGEEVFVYDYMCFKCRIFPTSH